MVPAAPGCILLPSALSLLRAFGRRGLSCCGRGWMFPLQGVVSVCLPLAGGPCFSGRASWVSSPHTLCCSGGTLNGAAKEVRPGHCSVGAAEACEQRSALSNTPWGHSGLGLFQRAQRCCLFPAELGLRSWPQPFGGAAAWLGTVQGNIPSLAGTHLSSREALVRLSTPGWGLDSP